MELYMLMTCTTHYACEYMVGKTWSYAWLRHVLTTMHVGKWWVKHGVIHADDMY